MKILYVSCHSILEYDELRIFDSLGIEVFSLGTYLNPNEDWHAKTRPKLKLNNWKYENYESYVKYFDHTKIPDCRLNISKEFADCFDIIYFHSWIDAVKINWENIKHKIIVLRSVGQISSQEENLLNPYIKHGNVKIVRYSPLEKVNNYNAEDVVIRYSKRNEEWGNWRGDIKSPATVAQTFKTRNIATCYPFFLETSKILPCSLYGINNDGVEGHVKIDDCLETLYDVYRKHAVYYSFGTKPAPYTLNFIEAWMTGIPIIAVGPKNGNYSYGDQQYEVPFLIEHGVSGFVSDDPAEFASIAKMLINDDKLSKTISENGRANAIKFFDDSNNKPLWKEFFKLL
jgi:hypothetical protein